MALFIHKQAKVRHQSAKVRDRLMSHFTESAGTIFTLVTPMRLTGRSPGCVGVVAIFSRTSSPLMSLPNAVYWRSRKRGSPWQMKNCEPAELGSFERAMER